MILSALNPVLALLATSLIGAAVLAFIRDYRWSARLNILFSGVVLAFAVTLFHPPADRQFSADRRSQCRLHRAQRACRLHHQYFQRELYRP